MDETSSGNVYPKAVIAPTVITVRRTWPIVPLAWLGKDTDLGMPGIPGVKAAKKKNKKIQPNLPLLYPIPIPGSSI